MGAVDKIDCAVDVASLYSKCRAMSIRAVMGQPQADEHDAYLFVPDNFSLFTPVHVLSAR